MNFDDFKIPDEILREIQNPELIRNYIREGKNLREIIGYHPAKMEEFYRSASSLLEKQKFHEAQDAFLFLTTIDPNVYLYWMGLGIAYHRLEEFEQALLSYQCAVLLDRESPVPHFYSASCQHCLGKREEAKEELHRAETKARQNEAYSEYIKKIEQAFTRIK